MISCYYLTQLAGGSSACAGVYPGLGAGLRLSAERTVVGLERRAARDGLRVALIRAPARRARPAPRGDVSGGSDGRVPSERLPPQHAPPGCSAQHDRDEDPAVPGLPALLRWPRLLYLTGYHLPEPGRHGRSLPGHQELHRPVLRARLPAAVLLRHTARN